ncbi:Acyltransferase family protein [Candidatus Bilamarchaeum dharawalense]|uniref:Acyltransferase family protein n=1 Tax=Candidatus Bilamarchaeum dharawalense TaxID=2885759 RepID=A0A5E4LQ75_9ARCH|nr:Acyltransferase family protein [Candidatus Bilamarchaeum dharawalense]
MKERLGWIDFGRALAIFLVVVFHVAYQFTRDENLRIVGFLGVSLFFIISGFMLSTKYPKLRSFDLKWFFKRYVKVASIYYLAIIAIVILFANQSYQQGIYDILLHFLFLNWLDPSTQYTLISPSWFLIPLMALYLAYPYLNKLIRKSEWFVVVAFIITIIYGIQENSPLTSFSLLFFLAQFCFGMASAQGIGKIMIIGPLLMAIYNPLLAIPYIVFWIIYLSKIPPIGSITLISKHTIEIFLFHEAIMNVCIGKWNVYGLEMPYSLLITISCFLVATLIASRLQKLVITIL